MARAITLKQRWEFLMAQATTLKQRWEFLMARAISRTDVGKFLMAEPRVGASAAGRRELCDILGCPGPQMSHALQQPPRRAAVDK